MNKPKTRSENIVIQEMGHEILIYDLKENKAFCLNETSALIWQLCDGNKTVTEISEKLSEQLKQTIKEDLVWLALDSFKKDNLLEENKEKFKIDFNGLNRRQVIKKAGLASLVALPVISSLVAPTATAAASVACSITSCLCPAGTPFGTTCGVGAGDPGYLNCNTGCSCRVRFATCGNLAPDPISFCTGDCV